AGGPPPGRTDAARRWTWRRTGRRLPPGLGPARGCETLRRPAHRQPLDPQGGLAHADRHALAVLAADADAAVELHVVADHRHPRKRIRAVADDGGALHRILDLPVLHPV